MHSHLFMPFQRRLFAIWFLVLTNHNKIKISQATIINSMNIYLRSKTRLSIHLSDSSTLLYKGFPWFTGRFYPTKFDFTSVSTCNSSQSELTLKLFSMETIATSNWFASVTRSTMKLHCVTCCGTFRHYTSSLTTITVNRGRRAINQCLVSTQAEAKDRMN